MIVVLAIGRHYKPRSKSTDISLLHANYFYFLFIKKSNFPSINMIIRKKPGNIKEFLNANL